MILIFTLRAVRKCIAVKFGFIISDANNKCDVYRIRNDFFGETITVTGLITAGDLIAQLKGKDLGEELLISSAMVKRDEPIFLDDLTVSDVEAALGLPLKTTGSDGYELLDAMLGIEY